MSNGYSLRLPVDKGQWVMLISNKPMRPEHFVKLDEYLALQKEIAANDEPCDSGSDRNGEDTEGG